MNDIQKFVANKYSSGGYEEQGDDVYKQGDKYFISLSFKQEPDHEEGESALDISQYPLEDILEHFCVHISDFYDELNTQDTQLCHLEFASTNKDDICRLREIISKHVYNKMTTEDGIELVELVIE